jgi:hypothetical protein
VFNYVSWTDPKSADIRKPDVYSVACVAGYNESKQNFVNVFNYKGNKGFGNKEQNWKKMTMWDANRDNYRKYRE